MAISAAALSFGLLQSVVLTLTITLTKTKTLTKTITCV